VAIAKSDVRRIEAIAMQISREEGDARVVGAAVVVQPAEMQKSKGSNSGNAQKVVGFGKVGGRAADRLQPSTVTPEPFSLSPALFNSRCANDGRVHRNCREQDNVATTSGQSKMATLAA
jgi:hypothetical protein